MSTSSMLPSFADDPELAALLAASVQAHTSAAEQKAAAASASASKNPFEGDDQQDVIAFGQDEDEEDEDDADDAAAADPDEEFESAAARIAKERSTSDTWQATAQAALSHPRAASFKSSSAQVNADEAFDRIEAGDTPSELSQRARKRQSREARAATAGDGWFGLPRLMPTSTTSSTKSNWNDEGLTPAQRARLLTSGHKNASVAVDARGKTSAEIAREVQAIRLRNALDPKRFYRGARADRALALPEFAQIGTILPDEIATRQNMSRSERSATKGSVVEELLRDDTAKEYATRKFGELQETRGAWQAGKGQKRKADGKKGRSGKKQRQ
ncbi:hypothetical protein V8E36_009512 [Tilletia maclaganii]